MVPVSQGFPEDKVRQCMPSTRHIVRAQRLQEAPEAGIIFLLYSTVSEIQKGEAMCPRSHSMSTLGLWTSCPQA